jgi:hypothetical protein
MILNINLEINSFPPGELIIIKIPDSHFYPQNTTTPLHLSTYPFPPKSIPHPHTHTHPTFSIPKPNQPTPRISKLPNIQHHNQQNTNNHLSYIIYHYLPPPPFHPSHPKNPLISSKLKSPSLPYPLQL